MKRTIIVPHAGDEVYSCYSTLQPGTQVIVVSHSEYYAASEEIVSKLGCEIICLEYDKATLPNYWRELQEDIESTIEINKCELYYPAKSYNHARQFVRQIAKRICDPQATRQFTRVYEYPSWGTEHTPYNRLTKVDPIGKKVAMCNLLNNEATRACMDYTESLNLHLGVKHKLPEKTWLEPFNLLMSIRA